MEKRDYLSYNILGSEPEQTDQAEATHETQENIQPGNNYEINNEELVAEEQGMQQDQHIIPKDNEEIEQENYLEQIAHWEELKEKAPVVDGTGEETQESDITNEGSKPFTLIKSSQETHKKIDLEKESEKTTWQKSDEIPVIDVEVAQRGYGQEQATKDTSFTNYVNKDRKHKRGLLETWLIRFIKVAIFLMLLPVIGIVGGIGLGIVAAVAGGIIACIGGGLGIIAVVAFTSTQLTFSMIVLGILVAITMMAFGGAVLIVVIMMVRGIIGVIRNIRRATKSQRQGGEF